MLSMSGLRMHLNCFLAVFMFEDCLGDSQLALCAQLEQMTPTIVAIIDTAFSKESFPGLKIPPNSGIEVTKDLDLLSTEVLLSSLLRSA